MDSNFIQAHRDEIIEMCEAYHPGDPDDAIFAIVGSRVRDDYTENSDLDIIVFSKTAKKFGNVTGGKIDGVRYMLATRKISELNTYRGFSLSYFDLRKNILVIGEDDAAFVEQRNAYRERMSKCQKN